MVWRGGGRRKHLSMSCTNNILSYVSELLQLIQLNDIYFAELVKNAMEKLRPLNELGGITSATRPANNKNWPMRLHRKMRAANDSPQPIEMTWRNGKSQSELSRKRCTSRAAN